MANRQELLDKIAAICRNDIDILSRTRWDTEAEEDRMSDEELRTIVLLLDNEDVVQFLHQLEDQQSQGYCYLIESLHHYLFSVPQARNLGTSVVLTRQQRENIQSAYHGLFQRLHTFVQRVRADVREGRPTPPGILPILRRVSEARREMAAAMQPLQEAGEIYRLWENHLHTRLPSLLNQASRQLVLANAQAGQIIHPGPEIRQHGPVAAAQWVANVRRERQNTLRMTLDTFRTVQQRISLTRRSMDRAQRAWKTCYRNNRMARVRYRSVVQQLEALYREAGMY